MTRSWLWWYRADLFESEEGSQQPASGWLGLWEPSVSASLTKSQSDLALLRSEVLTPIMIHNLQLEVNLICHWHNQTKCYSDQDHSPIMMPGVKTQLISVIASWAEDDAEPFCSNYFVCLFHGSPPPQSPGLWLVSSCLSRPLIGCWASHCAAPAHQECPISSSPLLSSSPSKILRSSNKNILRDAPQIRLSGVIQPAPSVV